MREMLSPDAQRLFDNMDVDASFYEWNIQKTDGGAFDELIKKGYLIRVQDNPAMYKFADDIVAAKDREMLR